MKSAREDNGVSVTDKWFYFVSFVIIFLSEVTFKGIIIFIRGDWFKCVGDGYFQLKKCVWRVCFLLSM